jgi:hypothetical protein
VWEGSTELEKSILAQKVSQTGLWIGERLRLDTAGTQAVPKTPQVVAGNLGLGVVWESNQTGNEEIYFSLNSRRLDSFYACKS